MVQCKHCRIKRAALIPLCTEANNRNPKLTSVYLSTCLRLQLLIDFPPETENFSSYPLNNKSYKFTN